MKRTMWAMACGTSLLLAGAPLVALDDDLAVVKKAVATSQAAPAPLTPEAPAEAARAPLKGGGPPQWLRVRVFEKGRDGKESKRVSVNLPLSLVRAMDELPIDLCSHHPGRDDQEEADRGSCSVKLGDVLAVLEAGQELVEIDGDDGTVKVWVE